MLFILKQIWHDWAIFILSMLLNLQFYSCNRGCITGVAGILDVIQKLLQLFFL